MHLAGGWQLPPGTTNNFGGSSTTEYGPLLKTVYPEAGFKMNRLINNFNSGDMANPCPVLARGSPDIHQ